MEGQKAPEKFISTINEKCEKENVNFDQKFPEITAYNGMNKDQYLFTLQNEQAFKEKFLIPHYKMRNLLEILNETMKRLSQKQLSEKAYKKKKRELLNIRKQLANSRLEIYFCNVSDNQTIKPFANATQPYGLIHVGLLVDDVCIQWGRSILGKSIVNPSKDVIYNDYIFAIELENNVIWNLIKEMFNHLDDYLTKKKDVNSMETIKALEIANNQLDIIAHECVNYNVNKNYNLVFKNCQHFADKIIKKMGMTVNKNGETGNVLSMAMDKLNKFDFSFRGKDFKTRADLDNYIRINDFRQFSKEERRVLFNYRNVFDYWGRAYPNEEKYKTTDMAKDFWDDLAEKEKFE